MAEFPEARIRTRSGLEWADQKTVMEVWSAAPEDVRERFAAMVAGVADSDLVQVCEDLVAAVVQLRSGEQDGGQDAGGEDGEDGGEEGEQDPPHDPPADSGDDTTPDPEPGAEPDAEAKPAGRRRSTRR